MIQLTFVASRAVARNFTRHKPPPTRLLTLRCGARASSIAGQRICGNELRRGRLRLVAAATARAAGTDAAPPTAERIDELPPNGADAAGDERQHKKMLQPRSQDQYLSLTPT